MEAGLPSGDVRVLVPSDAPTKGNLVARYRGRDTGRAPLLLLAHIDVVVSGLFADMDDNRAHGQDERVRVEHFYEGQEFLYRLVKALSGGGVV